MALTKPQTRQDKSIILQNSIDITPDDIQDNQISIDQKNARINFISISDNKRKVSTVFETEEGAVAAGAIIEPILTSNDTNGTAPTSNPFVGMIGIHYQKDTMGSIQINSK